MAGDHFYTTSIIERDNAIGSHGYIDEGIAGYVYSSGAQSYAPFYRMYAPWNGDHFYTSSLEESDNAIRGGFVFEGIACNIYQVQAAQSVEFYRMYNSYNGDHFYTTSLIERNNAINTAGYRDEGVAGFVFQNAAAGRQALYRLYNRKNGDHFYTTSIIERDNAIQTYQYRNEGIACYVPDTSVSRYPFYRMYAPGNGDHFYTIDINERGNALNNGYITEGIACYVVDQNFQGSTPLYRLYYPTNGDHFYTTDPAERNNAIAIGYNNEGEACNIFNTQQLDTIPLYRLYKGFSKYLGLNMILVGNDGFSAAEIQQVLDSLGIAKAVFATVNIGIDNLQWYGIPISQAGSYTTINSGGEAKDLTDDWTVKNDNLDLFIVRMMTFADGYSAVNGSCDKDSKLTTGTVVSLNGSTGNSGNTFAHEIAHYLGLDHIPDSGNFIGGNGSSNSWTGIFQWQGDIMKKHCFMHT